MKRSPRLGVGWQMSIFTSVMTLITVMGMSTVSYMFTRKFIFARLEDRLPSLIELKSDQVKLYLNYMNESLVAVANRREVAYNLYHYHNNQTWNAAQLSENFASSAALTYSALAMQVYGISPSGKHSILATFSHSNFTPPFHAAPGTSGFTAPFVLNSQYNVFVWNMPVMHNQQVVGAIAAVFNTIDLQNLLDDSEATTEASGSYFLVSPWESEYFKILAPSKITHATANTTFLLGSDASVAASLADNASPSMITRETNFMGIDVVAAYAPCIYGNTRWGLIYQARYSEVTEPLNELITLLLYAALVVIAVMIVATIPLVMVVFRRIKHLNRVTSCIFHAPIDTGLLQRSRKRFCSLEDEVSDLHDSFSTLADSLNDQYYFQEARIAERTKHFERAKNEAIVANNAKSTFLAKMSHEMRTPLVAILGLSDPAVIESEANAKIGAAQMLQLLTDIHKSGTHLLFLLNDILDFAKIEKGILTLENKPFRLGSEVIDLIHSIYQPSAKAKGLDLLMDIQPATLRQGVFVGDKHRLLQIIQNLVGNSLKFTAAGFVRLRIRAEQDNVEICVEDSGCGMSKLQLDRLWEPFSQGSEGTNRKFEGSGLGLSISHQLATLMGGYMSASSTETVGSTFTFTVPLPRADQEVVQTAHHMLPSDAPARCKIDDVLVVDDNQLNRTVMKRMLTKCQIKQIDVAVDGLDAIAKATPKDYDVIFMDISMPTCDGLEATRELRKAGYKGIITALTAHIGTTEHDAALAAGMNFVLHKPLQLSALKEFLFTIEADMGENNLTVYEPIDSPD